MRNGKEVTKMDNKEFNLTLYICTPMVISFVLFPAFCFITIWFGYVWPGFIVMEVVAGALIIPCFIARTWFLVRCRQYATKRRLFFETFAYIACIAFAIGTAFLVKESDGVFTYYPFNIYIQPLYMIFVFVVMGYRPALPETGTNQKALRVYGILCGADDWLSVYAL